MFICSFDGKAHGPSKKLNKVVVEVRKRAYYVEYKKENEEGEKEVITKNTTGWEIVREVDACDDCASKHGHKNYLSMI